MRNADIFIALLIALLGGAALWAALLDVDRVFQLRKLAYLESRLGRGQTRVVVAVGGVLLLALAASFVVLPPE